VALIGKFEVAKLALPLIGLGLPLFFSGRHRLRDYGEALIGFGLVFFGLGLLKDSVPDLRSMMVTDPATAQMIEGIVTTLSGHGYGSVLMFLVAGIFLTLLVQSSSAAMAITITCALNGWLGDLSVDPLGVFRNSAAIVLGENIGTTVTAWLASTGANTSAKRAARAHFTFNVIGIVWCLVLYLPFTSLVWWVANQLPEGLRSANQSMAQSEVAFATAIFHSAFNLANIMALVWFVPNIERLVIWWVRDDDAGRNPARLRYIGNSLVDIGELSLAEADEATRQMADLTSDMFNGLLEVLENPTVDMSERVSALKAMEDECDQWLHDITSYLIQCSTHEIGAGNAARITSMLRVVAEYEEATDRIYRMVKVVQRKYQKGRDFTEVQHQELKTIASQVRLMLDVARNSLIRWDGTSYELAHEIEDRIDRLRKRNNKSAAQRMQDGAVVQTEMIFIDLNNHMEAVGNLLLNIIQAGRRS
jgi:phosphate:Na+ symporter